MSRQSAVLCAEEIRALCDGDELISDVAHENFVGAKYDLRMADDGLVLPSGTVVKPGETPYQEDIVLDSGGTIFVSTRERLSLPPDLVGNMSIKGELAQKGILSLTGLIVDPGYKEGSSGDGRLHFRLANLGTRPVVLRPGSTRIASIQFLRLSQPASPVEMNFPDIWKSRDGIAHGLGFVDEIRKVQSRVSDLTMDFERQKRSVSYVVLAGILVIMATLLGVAVSGLLSLGSDSQIVDSAKNVIPDDSVGQTLAVTLILGLAMIASITVIALGYRVGERIADLDERVLARQEALREERVLRYRRVGIYWTIATALVAAAVAVPVALGAPAWISPASGLLFLLVAVALFPSHGWQPITPDDLSKRLLKWQSGGSG